MRELPVRRPNRLRDYDYSQNGAYFVTVCTKDKAELFGTITETVRGHARMSLTTIGKTVEAELERMSRLFDSIDIACYVVMPNHVHMIVVIYFINDGDRNQAVPTVSRLVQQWKGIVTKQIGFSPWQKSFHDHIISNELELKRIAEYIENNPATWDKDCFYVGAE